MSSRFSPSENAFIHRACRRIASSKACCSGSQDGRDAPAGDRGGLKPQVTVRFQIMDDVPYVQAVRSHVAGEPSDGRGCRVSIIVPSTCHRALVRPIPATSLSLAASKRLLSPVRETNAAFRVAFERPEFRAKIGRCPSSCMVRPYLFEKLAVAESARPDRRIVSRPSVPRTPSERAPAGSRERSELLPRLALPAHLW